MNILIVDDDPVIRLLASTAIEKLDGFTVTCAADGSEGLRAAAREPFDLVLLDSLMPGLSGHDVLVKLRERPETRRYPVAFLTARDVPDEDYTDDGQPLDVAAVIRKPFDPTTLGQHVLDILGTRRGETSHVPTASPSAPDPVVGDLVKAFLVEGANESAGLLETIGRGGPVDESRVQHLAHRWLGRGGTFGYPTISTLAGRIVRRVERGPADPDALATEIRQIHEAFVEAPARGPVETDTPEPEAVEEIVGTPGDAVLQQVAESLDGVRVALVGFGDADVERLDAVLVAAGAFTRSLSVDPAALTAADVARFDLVITFLPGRDASGEPEPLGIDLGRPLLVAGSARRLNEDGMLPTASDVLVWPAPADELLLRAHRLMTPSGEAQGKTRDEVQSIIIADDDTTVDTLLDHTLSSYDFECHIVESGDAALDLARRLRPTAVILDVNMPGMNGFEVLSHLKGSRSTRDVPVLMLTARSRETDILRGFSLGADDYVVKPFNPMELVARLKRVLKAAER